MGLDDQTFKVNETLPALNSGAMTSTTSDNDVENEPLVHWWTILISGLMIVGAIIVVKKVNNNGSSLDASSTSEGL